MAPRGGDDKLNFDGTADFSQPRQEIQSILDKLKELGKQATTTGKKVDTATTGEAKNYAALATAISQAARAEADLSRSAEQARTARANASTAGSNSFVAAGSAQSKVSQSGSQAELAAEKVLTEQVRRTNMERESGNKQLIAQSQVALINEKRQETVEARAEKARAAQSRQQTSIQTQMDKAFADQERTANAEIKSNERIRSQQESMWGARETASQKQRDSIARSAQMEIAADNKAQDTHERNLDALDKKRAAATERDTQRNQRAIYQQYMDQQNAYDRSNGIGNLNATRYALFGISQTAFVVGGALAAVGVGATVLATNFEKDFSTVQRAAELTGDEIGNVRGQLTDLSTSVVASFSDITSAATLGAQLGIAGDDLANFSRVVTEFSSTTNASLDTTAQSFGRISNLLDVPATKFDNLGSAIYQVGIKSVATETEILSTSQQIAGAAAAYNFTADQVVGLGAAFASLAIAPEAARGSVTRIFGKIEQAVTKGGASLQAYADILNMTQEDTKKLWQTDPSAFFTQLVQGLSKSKNLLVDLQKIGASANVRDTSLLQRLAGNPDLLVKALGVSADAYNKGTALQKAYAIQADTLAAKLSILANTFAALGASAGGPFAEGLKVAVDILQFLLKQLSDNAWIAFAVVLIASIVGGFILVKGATAAALGALLAIQFVLKQVGTSAAFTGVNLRSLNAVLLQTKEMAGIGSVSVRGFSDSIKGAGYAVKSFAKATIIMAAITAAFEVLSVVTDTVQDSFKSAADRAKDYFGDLSGYSDAVKKDTETYNAYQKAVAEANRTGAEAPKDNTGTITTYTTTLKQKQTAQEKDAEATKVWLGVQEGVAGGANAGTEAITKQTYALGVNADAWIRQQFVNQDGFKKLANNPELLSSFEKFGGNINTLIKKGLEGKGESYVESIIANGQKAIDLANQKAGGKGSPATGKLISDTQNLKDILGPAARAVDGLANSQTNAANTAKLFGLDTQGAADDVENLGNGAGQAAVTVTSLSDQVKGLFAQYDTAGQFATAITTLFQGIAEGGNSFSAFSQAGQTNLANLQQTILATADYASSIGVNVNDSLVPLFANLKAQGVDTKSILDNLAKQPIIFEAGIDVSAVQQGLAAVSSGTKSFSLGQQLLNNLMADGSKQGKKLAATNKSVGSSAAGAAAQVRTLSDYVSDLQTAFGKAFEFRFGKQQALDDVTSKWMDIAKAQAEADQNLRQYLADLEGLEANKSLLEFQYTVAVAYGDTLHAQQIHADIAKANADIAAKQQQVSDATDATNKTLVGNSAAAIKNRSDILGLVQAYEAQAAAIVNSSASDAQKHKQLSQLKKDFVNQAVQLGYNKTQVQKYAHAFDDMSKIIAKLPKDITVRASTDPAQRAIDELVKKNTGGAGISKGFTAPVSFKLNDGALKKYARGEALLSQISIWTGAMAKADQHGEPDEAKKYAALIQKASKKITSGDYADGGFVPWAKGNTRKDNGFGLLPSGRTVGLQGGEPIINNAARSKYGDKMFEEINAMKFKPTVVVPQTIVVKNDGAGDGDMMMLLRHLGNSGGGDVYIDGTKVTSVINDKNRVTGRRR